MAMDRESWHLDKRVPITLVLTLLAQTGAFVWWASGIDSRVAQLENTRQTQEQQDTTTSTQLAELNIKLTRLESNFVYLTRTQEEMKTDIRALLEEDRSK